MIILQKLQGLKELILFQDALIHKLFSSKGELHNTFLKLSDNHLFKKTKNILKMIILQNLPGLKELL